jgi:hypothetical protein
VDQLGYGLHPRCRRVLRRQLQQRTKPPRGSRLMEFATDGGVRDQSARRGESARPRPRAGASLKALEGARFSQGCTPTRSTPRCA